MVLVLCKPSGKRQRSATDTNQLLSDIWNQQQSELQKYGHCKSLFPTSEGTYFCPILGASPLCSLVIISTTYLWTLSFSYATCTFLSLLIFSLPTLPLTSFRIFLFGLMRPENSPTFFFLCGARLEYSPGPHTPYPHIALLLLLLLLFWYPLLQSQVPSVSAHEEEEKQTRHIRILLTVSFFLYNLVKNPSLSPPTIQLY